MKKMLFIAGALLLTQALAAHSQTVEAIHIEGAPLVDGVADELWSRIPETITHDAIADIDISLKAAYTDSEIYLLARFPDASENRKHKTLVWDSELGLYKVGPSREDTLIVKWGMEYPYTDLSLSANEPYKADIWYWKSHRTDHAGYADDKHQIYTHIKVPQSQPLVSKSGKLFYLARRGDAGRAAYESRLQTDHEQPEMPAFNLIQPEGSRADVRAKGKWDNGYWTIEFSRKLSTGHGDDVDLDIHRKHHFGISRFEVAGRKPNPKIEEPNFGSGEISETLILHFSK